MCSVKIYFQYNYEILSSIGPSWTTTALCIVIRLNSSILVLHIHISCKFPPTIKISGRLKVNNEQLRKTYLQDCLHDTEVMLRLAGVLRNPKHIPQSRQSRAVRSFHHQSQQCLDTGRRNYEVSTLLHAQLLKRFTPICDKTECDLNPFNHTT